LITITEIPAKKSSYNLLYLIAALVLMGVIFIYWRKRKIAV
jgi:LPXTG-motif cell wall-anchored protein